MEVAVSALRAAMKRWLDEVQAGNEVVVTERGRPVARLCPVESASLVERLEQTGKLLPPEGDRVRAADLDAVRARGSVSELLTRERDALR